MSSDSLPHEASKETTATSAEEMSEDSFSIMGIGASAGGLSALKKLFACVSEDSGLAFVVVVHLSPEHDSHLAELLQPHVRVPVQQVTQTVLIEPNHVYVIPPNANLDTVDTHLRLTDLEERRQERAPIDHFFRTLADNHGDHAIGVILTGTGSDGTLGLRRIKELGGLTVVQDPAEAEYDGMPQSAVAAAPVDLVLRLQDIPEAVLRFTRTKPRIDPDVDETNAPQSSQKLLLSVCAHIKTRTGRDFSRYKASTLLRRIARRMQLNHLQELPAYLELLRESTAEVYALADDLLINVTSFFRDADVFDALEKMVVPQLFEGKDATSTVRVWSVGCATGEEAYSIAILLLEYASHHEAPAHIQVFASDLHAGSLAKAREGIYPGDIETDVQPERLRRFFIKEDNGYRVRKEVRDAVVFAPHSVLSDPPFSRLDLLLCRNLLIYLQRSLQQQVIEIFHYALNAEGFLLLGTSETAEAAELFDVEDKKNCIYRKRDVPAPEPKLAVFPLMHNLGGRSVVHHQSGRAYGTFHQRLVERHAPPSVLLNSDNHVVHLSDSVNRYLQYRAGAPTTDIFKLVGDELRAELYCGLQTAREKLQTVRSHPITVKVQDAKVDLVLDLRPASDGFMLLTFDDRAALEALAPEGHDTSLTAGEGDARGREVKSEREVTEQRLQAVVEEYRATQEEIRASNEELQSTNEELRSTLEELETSKEELQSMNEELQSVNQENRHKVEELDQLSTDLQNLMAATDIATLFLDRELRILRFTPKISELFNVRMTDRGRALTDFTHRLGYDELQKDAKNVLQRLIPLEREVQDEAGRWYLTRVLPYRSSEDRIAGVVVTFVDITRRREAEEEVLRAKDNLERIIEALPEPLLVLDADLKVSYFNAAFKEQLTDRTDQLRGLPIYKIDNGEWNIPQLHHLLETLLPEKRAITNFLVDHEFSSGTRRVLLLNARQLEHMNVTLLGLHDITERHAVEQALRGSEARYRALAELSPEAIFVSIDGRFVYTNQAAAELLGIRQASKLLGQSPFDFLKEDNERVTSQLTALLDEQQPVARMTYRWTRFDGVTIDVEVVSGPIEWESRAAVQVVARDITERKRTEDELRQTNQDKDQYLAMLGHELRNPLSAIRNACEVMKQSMPLEPRLDAACGVLDRQSTHMTRIIDGLLEVSRITMGKVSLEVAAVDLRDVLHHVLEDRGPELEQAGLTLIRNIPTQPHWVQGDEVRLVQIFDNLLGNAIKFTKSPGTVEVELVKDGASALVRVSDTGVGIRAEMLGRIFESFQQETQDTARSSGGLGLGLALCKGLVELHHGTIEASSRGASEGAEFLVRLPLGHAPKQTHKPQALSSLPARRICIVEDNLDTAEMLRELLELSKHRVILTRSGSEALEVLRTQAVDVVLCDLGLPGMNGFTFAREVRKDPSIAAVKLIALTGYGQPEDRKDSAAAGFDEHLLKPIDLEVLSSSLRRA